MHFANRTLMKLGVGIGFSTMGFLGYTLAQENVEKPVYPPPRPCTGMECPLTKWDSNWDGQHSNDQDLNVKMLERNIILIRHAEHNLEKKSDEDHVLTTLGTSQAKALSVRLKQLNLPYTSIQSSTMKRASETAHIIWSDISQVRPLTLNFMPQLNEGIPAHSIPHIPDWDLDDEVLFADSQRMEFAFRSIFHRSTDPNGPTYELFICHANIIRFFICRALQFPPEAWLRFSIPNCSITWIKISGNGRVVVQSIGEHSFLPYDKITY